MEGSGPTELGGPGSGTNPEQLFAVGYGACFTGALGLAGKAEGIDTTGASTDVNVGFGPEGGAVAALRPEAIVADFAELPAVLGRLVPA